MNVPPDSSRKRRCKLILISALAISLLALGAILALRNTGLETELAKLRSAGLPVAVEDLNTWYPPVPAENNAALAVIAAAELKTEENYGALQLPKRDETISPQFLQQIRDYVTENAGTLQALREALQLPESRYALSITANTLAKGLPNPHLSEIKGLMLLLHYETVHLVAGGKSDAAFAPVRDGFALAATLRNEPFLISELLRISFVAIALRSLECALPAAKFTDQELQELSERLLRSEADCSRSLYRAIIGERTMGIQFFTTIQRDFANSPSEWERFRGVLYRGLGFHDRDLRLYLEMMQGFAYAMTNSFPTAYERSVALDAELQKRYSKGLGRFATLSRAVMPGIAKASGKEAALVTGLRCARTAVAVERYRLANGGALPNDLDELVPKYLPELPRDGAKGEPLVFEQVPGGYQVSSPTAEKVLENKWNTIFRGVPWKYEK